MGVSAENSPVKKCYDCGNWLECVYCDPVDGAYFCERCIGLRQDELRGLANEQRTQHC